MAEKEKFLFSSPDVDFDEGQEEEQESENVALDEENQGEPQNEEEKNSEDKSEDKEAEILRKYGLEKFKTIEDALKSYKELEKKLGQDAEEKASLRREIEEIRQLLQPKEKEEEPDAEKWIESFMERGPAAVKEIVETVLAEQLAPIQEYLTREYYQREAEKFAAEHPDIEEYREDMKQILEEYPEIASHPKVYEIAYHIAKARKLEEKLPKIAENAKEEGKKIAFEKAAARLPGSSTRRAEKEKNPEELIREAVFGNMNQTRGVFD